MMAEIKLDGLDGVLDMLKQLPAEVTSNKQGGIVNLAMRKGARVLRDEARKNWKNIPKSESTGFTEKQIISKRKKMRAGLNGERQIVTVRYGKAHPSGNKKKGNKPILANDVAFIMEYGSSKQQSRPWIRPAFHSKAETAIQTISSDLKQRVDKAAQKHLKGGK